MKNFRQMLCKAGLVLLLATVGMSARAGIPVIDSSNLAQQVQQVIAWTQQAQQMIDQINKLQQQVQQLQAITSTLDGARALGTILNDPTIQASLPPEMRNASHLLLNPAAAATSAQNVAQILASFGISTSVNPTAGLSAADTIGRVQQMLTSAQQRNAQLGQLAARVDSSADAKTSLDLVNRTVLEAASITNQMLQTMGALESARSSAELRRIAENQQYFSNLNAASGTALRSYSY